MAEFASNGKANTGVALGAVGTGLGALATMGNGGLLGNLFGGCNNGWNNGYNFGSIPVNRYESEQQARIAQLETQVSLRDANTYADQKMLEMYKYFDGEVKDIRNTLCGQAVQNQRTADAFEMVRNDMLFCKNELYASIQRERDERCCADNSIVNYVNATFYPKMVADVTTGTTNTAQVVYNPLPRCGGCGCKD